MKPLLINIVGPTAAGKTDTAIWLAGITGAEIVSADSRQVYKEMQIGTAVPPLSERKGIPHHLLQHKSIREHYTAKDFETEALAVLRRLFSRHPVAIMVGGTGLYFHAVNNGLDEIPSVPVSVRESLQAQWQNEGLAPLLDELRRSDPEYYARVDRNNPRRILRALEVIRHTGRPFSSFHSARPKPRFFRSVWLGLTPPRPQLYAQINRRVHLMDEAGLEEEVRKLRPYFHLPALHTVGYREWIPYFEGHISREQVLDEIAKNTRRYAKRQLTWFRKNPAIHWFDPRSDRDHIRRQVETWIDSAR